MYEMRPVVNTEAHKTASLCEPVCSNSLKSTDIGTSQGALKGELGLLDSAVLSCAYKASVPAGGALAVDRTLFSKEVEKLLFSFDGFQLKREEINDIPDEDVIIATGPLTGKALGESIAKLLGESELYFYDAVAPIVTAESIDYERAFFLGRYGKGGDDYLNCPMNKDEYTAFSEALASAERVVLRDFEKGDVFEACMPIEVMAERGEDTMRFGPLRPVGITDPFTGKRPYAVVQLRREDNYNALFNVVGFQTNLKFPEQERVFRMIPALKNAEFARYGVMHRNTFINAPKALNVDFSAKARGNVWFAGQLSGVEGYMESCMSGLMAAINYDRRQKGLPTALPPEETMTGSLMRYIAAENENFQPMHVSFSLLPSLAGEIRDKKKRKQRYGERAVEAMKQFVNEI